jgi:hypothetical protein
VLREVIHERCAASQHLRLLVRRRSLALATGVSANARGVDRTTADRIGSGSCPCTRAGQARRVTRRRVTGGMCRTVVLLFRTFAASRDRSCDRDRDADFPQAHDSSDRFVGVGSSNEGATHIRVGSNLDDSRTPREKEALALVLRKCDVEHKSPDGGLCCS